MNRLEHKTKNSGRRARRVRTLVQGTSERPRLSVHVSNLHVTAQIIDDSKGATIGYASTVGQKTDGNKTKMAESIGKEIAAIAGKAKIKRVAFDRGSRKYHGRIKSLADAARKEGLEF